MECLLPSEIARLVYGYLEEQKCEEAAQNFLERSPYLSECLSVARSGKKFSTCVQGCSLSDVLDEYCAVQTLVADRLQKLPDCSSELLKSRGGLIDKLKLLLDSAKSGQTVAVSISVLPHSGNAQNGGTSGSSHSRTKTTHNSHDRKRSIRFQGHENKHRRREKEQNTISQECSVETTPLETLPGLCEHEVPSAASSKVSKSLKSDEIVSSERRNCSVSVYKCISPSASTLEVHSNSHEVHKSCERTRNNSRSSTNSVPDSDISQEINLNSCESHSSANVSPKRKIHSKKKTTSVKVSSLKSRKPSIDAEDEDSVAATLHRALLNSTELHEKIAENINSVIRIPSDHSVGDVSCGIHGSEDCEGVIQELNDAIKMVVDKTQEDPVFERLLEEIIGPNDEDMSSSPAGLESETDDATDPPETSDSPELPRTSVTGTSDASMSHLTTSHHSSASPTLLSSIKLKENNLQVSEMVESNKQHNATIEESNTLHCNDLDINNQVSQTPLSSASHERSTVFRTPPSGQERLGSAHNLDTPVHSIVEGNAKVNDSQNNTSLEASKQTAILIETSVSNTTSYQSQFGSLTDSVSGTIEEETCSKTPKSHGRIEKKTICDDVSVRNEVNRSKSNSPQISESCRISKKELKTLMIDVREIGSLDALKTPSKDIPLKQRLRSAARKSDTFVQAPADDDVSVDKSLEDQNAKAVQFILEANRKSVQQSEEENISTNSNTAKIPDAIVAPNERKHLLPPNESEISNFPSSDDCVDESFPQQAPEHTKETAKIDDRLQLESKNVPRNEESGHISSNQSLSERVQANIAVESCNNKSTVNLLKDHPASDNFDRAQINILKEPVMMLTIPNTIGNNSAVPSVAIPLQPQSSVMIPQVAIPQVPIPQVSIPQVSIPQVSISQVTIPQTDSLQSYFSQDINKMQSHIVLSHQQPTLLQNVETIQPRNSQISHQGGKQVIVNDANSPAVIVCDSQMPMPTVFDQYSKGVDNSKKQIKIIKPLAPRPIRPKPPGYRSGYSVQLIPADVSPQYIWTHVPSENFVEMNNISSSSSRFVNIANVAVPKSTPVFEKKICVCTIQNPNGLCPHSPERSSENSLGLDVQSGKNVGTDPFIVISSKSQEPSVDKSNNIKSSTLVTNSANSSDTLSGEDPVTSNSKAQDDLSGISSIATNDPKEVLDMSSLLMFPDQEKIMKPRDTPQTLIGGKSFQNPRRLSLSTPRRRANHIRTLDFGTPPKSGTEFSSLKKSQTSPKISSKSNSLVNEDQSKSNSSDTHFKPSTHAKHVRSSLFTSPDPPVSKKNDENNVTKDPQLGHIATRSPITHLMGEWDKATGFGLIFNGISPEIETTRATDRKITPKTLLFSPESDSSSDSDSDQNQTSGSLTENNIIIENKSSEQNSDPENKQNSSKEPTKQKLKARAWDADLRLILSQDFENVFVPGCPKEVIVKDATQCKREVKEKNVKKIRKKKGTKKGCKENDTSVLATDDCDKDNRSTEKNMKYVETKTISKKKNYTSSKWVIDDVPDDNNQSVLKDSNDVQNSLEKRNVDDCSNLALNFSKKRSVDVGITEPSSAKRAKIIKGNEKDEVEKIFENILMSENQKTTCETEENRIEGSFESTTLGKITSISPSKYFQSPVMVSTKSLDEQNNQKQQKTNGEIVQTLEIRVGSDGNVHFNKCFSNSLSNTQIDSEKTSVTPNKLVGDSVVSTKMSASSLEMRNCDVESTSEHSLCKEISNSDLIKSLATPVKHDAKYLFKNFNPMTPGSIDGLFPMTPRVLSPSNQEDTPITKLLRCEPCINYSLIVTPTLPPTPTIITSPDNLESPTSYISRPTDYSSCSSYYNPSKSIDTPSKIEQELIQECTTIENNGNKSLENFSKIISAPLKDINSNLNQSKQSDTGSTKSCQSSEVPSPSIPLAKEKEKEPDAVNINDNSSIVAQEIQNENICVTENLTVEEALEIMNREDDIPLSKLKLLSKKLKSKMTEDNKIMDCAVQNYAKSVTGSETQDTEVSSCDLLPQEERKDIEFKKLVSKKNKINKVSEEISTKPQEFLDRDEIVNILEDPEDNESRTECVEDDVKANNSKTTIKNSRRNSLKRKTKLKENCEEKSSLKPNTRARKISAGECRKQDCNEKLDDICDEISDSVRKDDSSGNTSQEIPEETSGETEASDKRNVSSALCEKEDSVQFQNISQVQENVKKAVKKQMEENFMKNLNVDVTNQGEGGIRVLAEIAAQKAEEYASLMTTGRIEDRTIQLLNKKKQSSKQVNVTIYKESEEVTLFEELDQPSCSKKVTSTKYNKKLKAKNVCVSTTSKSKIIAGKRQLNSNNNNENANVHKERSYLQIRQGMSAINKSASLSTCTKNISSKENNDLQNLVVNIRKDCIDNRSEIPAPEESESNSPIHVVRNKSEDIKKTSKKRTPVISNSKRKVLSNSKSGINSPDLVDHESQETCVKESAVEKVIPSVSYSPNSKYENISKSQELAILNASKENLTSSKILEDDTVTKTGTQIICTLYGSEKVNPVETSINNENEGTSKSHAKLKTTESVDIVANSKRDETASISTQLKSKVIEKCYSHEEATNEEVSRVQQNDGKIIPINIEESCSENTISTLASEGIGDNENSNQKAVEKRLQQMQSNKYAETFDSSETLKEGKSEVDVLCKFVENGNDQNMTIVSQRVIEDQSAPTNLRSENLERKEKEKDTQMSTKPSDLLVLFAEDSSKNIKNGHNCEDNYIKENSENNRDLRNEDKLEKMSLSHSATSGGIESKGDVKILENERQLASPKKQKGFVLKNPETKMKNDQLTDPSNRDQMHNDMILLDTNEMICDFEGSHRKQFIPDPHESDPGVGDTLERIETNEEVKNESSSESDSDDSSDNSSSSSSDETSETSSSSHISLQDNSTEEKSLCVNDDEKETQLSGEHFMNNQKVQNNDAVDESRFCRSFENNLESEEINEILKSVSPVLNTYRKDQHINSELIEKKRRTLEKLKGVASRSQVKLLKVGKESEESELCSRKQELPIDLVVVSDSDKCWDESSMEEFPVLHLSDSESAGNQTPHSTPKKKIPAIDFEKFRKGTQKDALKLLAEHSAINVDEKDSGQVDIQDLSRDDLSKADSTQVTSEKIDCFLESHPSCAAKRDKIEKKQQDICSSLEHLATTYVETVRKINNHEMYYHIVYNGESCPETPSLEPKELIATLEIGDTEVSFTDSGMQDLMDLPPREQRECKFSKSGNQVVEIRGKNGKLIADSHNSEGSAVSGGSRSSCQTRKNPNYSKCAPLEKMSSAKNSKLRPLDLLYEEMVENHDSSTSSDGSERIQIKRTKTGLKAKSKVVKNKDEGTFHRSIPKKTIKSKQTSENIRYQSPLELISEYSSGNSSNCQNSFSKGDREELIDEERSLRNTSIEKDKYEELEDGEIRDSPLKVLKSPVSRRKNNSLKSQTGYVGTKRSSRADPNFSHHSLSVPRSKSRNSDSQSWQSGVPSKRDKLESASVSDKDLVCSLPPKKRKALSDNSLNECEKRARHDNQCKLLKNLNIDSFLNKVHGKDNLK